MTREEKISHLKDILSEINENDNAVCYLTSEDNELIESAIEALSQEPCPDTISRKDALNALAYDIKSFEFKNGVSKHMNEIANLLNTIYEIQSDNIKALPPVQPKYNANEWCTDCSEYNQEKHCCPRYNGVIRKAVEEIKQPKIKIGHWIPVSERLPEEKINPITEDFYEYQCTVKFGDFYDVRSYKFGDGHWWNDAGLMDRYVIAWMPLPEPYKAKSEVQDADSD